MEKTWMASWLFSQKMVSESQVQILDKAAGISLDANVL